MSPHSGLNLDGSKTILLQGNLAHNDAIHHTRFGSKKISSSEDIIQTFNEFLTLCCDHNKAFFFHKTVWHVMLYHQTKFGSKRIWNSEDISTVTVIILLYEPCGHDPEDSNPFFSLA